MLLLLFNYNNGLIRSITSLLVFALTVTSTIPLPAQDPSQKFSIGFGSVKRNIRRYVKKVLHIHSHMTIGEVKSLVDSFRHYTKKITGVEMSGRELYYLASHEVSRKHSIDTSCLKSIFMTKEEMSFDEYLNSLPLEQRLGMIRKTLFSRSHVHKSVACDTDNKEVQVDGQVVIGFVLVACGTLISGIGYAIPPFAPITTPIAGAVYIAGMGFLGSGVYCTGENNRARNRKFFYVPEECIDTILSIEESTKEEDQV